ncbi:MAG: DUF4838 domain-containing protein [Clostridia bacterium]|nr:DUF4838 domain-containing protein [Clostridia bacterium]
MKKIISLLSIILALVMTFGAVSCKPKDDGNDGDNTVKTSVFNPDGITIEYTATDFIKNGQSDYVIVKPKESSQKEDFAAQDMQMLLKESTGVTLPIKTDDQVTYDANSKIISIGKTSFSEDKGLKISDTNYSGYVIKTVDNSIFIKGSTVWGTLRGTYAFLRLYFNYEYYAPEAYKINQVTEISLPKVDTLHNPAIAVSQGAPDAIVKDVEWQYRTGLMSKYNVWIMPDDNAESWTHNSLIWFPPSEFKETYTNIDGKSYYFRDTDELCFTSSLWDTDGDGNPGFDLDGNGIDDMLDIMSDRMAQRISESNELVQTSLIQQDTSAWCDCNDCKAHKAQYDSNLAILIKYANELIKLVDKKLETLNGNNDYLLVIICYQQTYDPPVKEDGNGGWLPIAEEVKCDEKLCIQFAPLRMVMHKDFYSSDNSGHREVLEKLHAVCDNVMIWWYGCYFHTYRIPLNNFEALQNTYRWFRDNGVYFSFHEGSPGGASGGWMELRLYLESKLSDTPELNVEELITDFFYCYYKDAAPALLDYFNTWRLQMNYNRDVLGMGGDVGSENTRAEYFPYGTLLVWNKNIDEAYAAIKHYETSDPELYKLLSDRICYESIFVRYALLKIYPDKFDATTLKAEQKAFKADCSRLNIIRETNAGSAGYLYNLWAEWGV